jgi:hypothetical protein
MLWQQVLLSRVKWPQHTRRGDTISYTKGQRFIILRDSWLGRYSVESVFSWMSGRCFVPNWFPRPAT